MVENKLLHKWLVLIYSFFDNFNGENIRTSIRFFLVIYLKTMYDRNR